MAPVKVVGFLAGLGIGTGRKRTVRRVQETGGGDVGKDSVDAEAMVERMRAYVKKDAALENSQGMIPSHKLVRLDDSGEPVRERFVYVDEIDCIGCTHCAMVARNTFFLEEDYGRARAFQQDGDPDELIATAIDTCPVNCIYYVPYEELVILERERETQNINPWRRLVGVSENRQATKSEVLSSANIRCENCPQRGCAKCPLYGVGENPTYMKRMAEKEKKRREKKSGGGADRKVVF